MCKINIFIIKSFYTKNYLFLNRKFLLAIVCELNKKNQNILLFYLVKNNVLM